MVLAFRSCCRSKFSSRKNSGRSALWGLAFASVRRASIFERVFRLQHWARPRRFFCWSRTARQQHLFFLLSPPTLAAPFRSQTAPQSTSRQHDYLQGALHPVSLLKRKTGLFPCPSAKTKASATRRMQCGLQGLHSLRAHTAV